MPERSESNSPTLGPWASSPECAELSPVSPPLRDGWPSLPSLPSASREASRGAKAQLRDNSESRVPPGTTAGDSRPCQGAQEKASFQLLCRGSPCAHHHHPAELRAELGLGEPKVLQVLSPARPDLGSQACGSSRETTGSHTHCPGVTCAAWSPLMKS